MTVTEDRPRAFLRTLLVSVATATVYTWWAWKYADDHDVDYGLWAGITLLVSLGIFALSTASTPPSRQTLWGLALGLLVGPVAFFMLALAWLGKYGA